LIPAEHYKYLTAFKAFDAVVGACFGNELDPNYRHKIKEFETAYDALGLAHTTKVHMLIEHADEEIEKYGVGLALFNEAAAESIHADFEKHYQGYIVKDVTASAYLPRLLHAVKSYNANHV
jgi:hypothetical protein